MVDYVQEFSDSFARVSQPELRAAFLDDFYRRFFAADPIVAEKFRGTDLSRQKEMLSESLSEMVHFFRNHASNPFIVTLARIHGVRGHDVPPRLYDLWLDCLVDAVRAHDPGATDNVALAWRIIMAPGIEFMKFFRAR